MRVTEQEVQEWVRLYRQGRSVREVTEVSGRSYRTVYSHLKAHTELRPPGAPRRSGLRT